MRSPLNLKPTEQSFQLGPELDAEGCINEMLDGLGNGFLHLSPWEPTEIAKGTVWVRVRCSWGSSIKFGTATIRVPYPHHLHNHATRRSISVGYVSRAAEPALRAPTGALWPMSCVAQPEQVDGGRGGFRNLSTQFTRGLRRFPALMRVLSLILAVRQL
jgi:hypothetical protein